MRRVFMLALFLAGLGLGCAHYHNPDGSTNWQQILLDARWGLEEGCSSQWVPADACTFGRDGLSLAAARATDDAPGTLAAVKQILVDTEAKVPADSNVRPYLDWVIRLIPG